MTLKPEPMGRAQQLTALGPTNAHRLGRAKSRDRMAVEQVLRAATPQHPVSIALVAVRCALGVPEARYHVHNTVGTGSAHNTNIGKVPALYAWGPGPIPVTAVAPTQSVPPAAHSSHADPRDYDGAELRPFTGRPGAMTAFALPSLIDGERVPRRAPMLIGGNAKERR